MNKKISKPNELPRAFSHGAYGPRRAPNGRFEPLREFVVSIPSEEEHMALLAKWALDKRWEN
jgi:hypothetical protein